MALLARIELASGHAERALGILNKVLDHNGTDMPPRDVGPMYQWRARTNAALHNYREAYTDLDEYVSRYRAANDAEHNRQANAAARALRDRPGDRAQRVAAARARAVPRAVAAARRSSCAGMPWSWWRACG